MSYGISITDGYAKWARGNSQGRKPADMPVVQSIKLEFVINLKTAKAIGLTVPAPLLAAADEVIE